MKVAVLKVTTMVAVFMALSAMSVSAQGIIKRGRFVVPFEFNVGQKVLPAGEYTVSGEGQTVRIQSRNGKDNVLALPFRTLGATNARSDVKLTFKRYGEHYVLSQVWLPDGLGRELRKQRNAEWDVAENISTVEIPTLTR